MALTYDEAIAALKDSQYQTLDGLRQLVSQISADCPEAGLGAVTLLSSGSVKPNRRERRHVPAFFAQVG